MFDYDDADYDADYDAWLESRQEMAQRMAELYDPDGEACLTAAERNPSMLR
jgi:hypothetical protein